MKAKSRLVRINEQLSVRMQKKLDREREVTGIFKSGAAYVNGLVAADLASQDCADNNRSAPQSGPSQEGLEQYQVSTGLLVPSTLLFTHTTRPES